MIARLLRARKIASKKTQTIFRAHKPIHTARGEHDLARIAGRKSAAKIRKAYPSDVTSERRACYRHFCLPLRPARPGPLYRSSHLLVLTVRNQDWGRSSPTVLPPNVESFRPGLH